MAFAALVSLAQTIELILNHRRDLISPELEDAVLSICHCVNDILQAFPEDFPDKFNSLEGRIREAAYAAEDVIEFLLSKQIHESFLGPLKSEFKDKERGFWQLYREDRRLRCAGKEWPQHQLWKRYRRNFNNLRNLNDVTKEIESIAAEVMEIKNCITFKDVQLSDPSSSSAAAPVHKDVMIGFDNDLMEMKTWLCGESSKLEVIPIVGMGGIGKTTLARNVYDEQLIVEHFEIRVWITVSQEYSVREIVLGLLASMKVFSATNESLQAHHVYQNLKCRRFLIVLDDIWSTEIWDDLKMMFPDDSNGSRIIVTTRLLDVASYPNSFSPIHQMHLMDDDQSWNLLLKKVFREDPCPVELEYVGKMIARSCRGLPLAIVVISGLLTVDQTKASWENIAEDVKSTISASNEQLEKILSLSYTRLPHHLRPCFLYMAAFPEDYKMRVSKLIRLWVAEGFLKPNGCKSFEETAEEYLEDLVKRSLILVTERKSNYRIKNISIHDLMREMCIKKSQEENFILQVRGSLQQGIEIPRRVSNFHNIVNLVEICSRVRTLIHVSSEGREVRSCCLGYFRLLRILNMSDSYDFFIHPYFKYHSFPAELFELFHLRYLAFDRPFDIPASISNLQNLQSLIIEETLGCHIELPVEIWRMSELRHLIICYCGIPLSFEEGAAFALENLHTLSGPTNFICTPKVLKMIPNLKKLGLYYKRSEDTYEGDYELHNLIYLQQLEKLKIEIHYNFPSPERICPGFPRTLKWLTLSGTGILVWEYMTIVGSLPNLEVLKLRDYACIGSMWETTEGEFSQLMFLLIDGSDLKHWITESSHFPKLKCLMLHSCSDLREIPYGIGEIPTLELIEVSSWDLIKSAKQIQEEQLNYGNDSVQVRHVFL